MPFDTIVIGSGFGGAVSACRLAEAGAKTLVLERGKRWQTAEFPRGPDDEWLFEPNDPKAHHGWIDLKIFQRMAVAQGAGVGGGSLIYANVSVPAQQFAFLSGWPAGIDFFQELQPHYATVGKMLDVHELPANQLTARAKLMRDAAKAVGDEARIRALPLAVTFDDKWSYELADPHNPDKSKKFTNAFGKQQGTCVHCGDCDLGCSVGARNTLDLNYLARAEQQGAEIRPLCLVQAIAPQDGGYRVDYLRLDTGAVVSETAKRVIVACGSLGSTELLLRCRDEHKTLPKLSPRLGFGWCSNGDFLTPALYFNRPVSPTRGPTITTAIDYLDGSDSGHRYFVEDGGFPDVIGNALRAVLGRHPIGQQIMDGWRMALNALGGGRDPLKTVMPWFGQGVDSTDGVMRLKRHLFSGKLELALDWDVTRSRPTVQAMVDRHVALSKATGGHAIVPAYWSLFHYLVTPHPLGGCNMGASAADGVVDQRGAVFGYPGLYVLDGSIVPRALGLNPSRTIAALAERNMQIMLH